MVEVHDQLGNAEDRNKSSKQITSKTSMLRSDLCDFSDFSDFCMTLSYVCLMYVQFRFMSTEKFYWKWQCIYYSTREYCFLHNISYLLLRFYRYLHVFYWASLKLQNIICQNFWLNKKVLNLRRNERHLSVYFGILMTQLYS